MHVFQEQSGSNQGWTLPQLLRDIVQCGTKIEKTNKQQRTPIKRNSDRLLKKSRLLIMTF